MKKSFNIGRWLRVSSLSIVLLIALGSPLAIFAVEKSLNLQGNWVFSLDAGDKGVSENWFNQQLKGSIVLPGVLQSQNYGDEISTKTPWVLSLYDRFWFLREDYKNYTKPGDTKVPFLSQPPRHYLGAAWYQREIEIPADWNGKRVVLFLERPHWGSTVWIDGKNVGYDRSLVAPHEYDLGSLAPGKHRISIRVDNRMLLPYRPDAHSVSDSLGMSWNGIVGKIELRARSAVWIDDVQVFTGRSVLNPELARHFDEVSDPQKSLESKEVIIRVRIGNLSGKFGPGTVSCEKASSSVNWDSFGGTAYLKIFLGKDAKAWDEFDPALQRLTVKFSGLDVDDEKNITFGWTDFHADGKNFMLNGRPVYFRGTHHGGDFPLTGYPPTDVAYWKKIFQINKDWGINHVRFHSFCPPEAAFVAADEVGIYLQPEPGMWNEISPGTEMERKLYTETDRMINAYGNHPSFLLLSPSNEPKGRWKESLDKWIAHYRKSDPRRLYTNGTGHTEREVPGLADGTDYLAMQRIGPKMLRGNSAWFGRDYGQSLVDINIPVVSHELGQWVAYPDYDIIKKFTGYMRPGNYEIFRDSFERKGLLHKNKEFAYASGKYQLECYKEEIEANLRTPGMSGFQLLDLHDYLGQGTALVGLLDAFWEEKGYVTAKEFRRFNNTTVPLARLTKRVFKTDENFSVDVEIAHFGKDQLRSASPYWKVVNEQGKAVAGDEMPSINIQIGKNIRLGTVRVDLSKLPAPHRYKLVVGLKNTEFENDWNFWLYPPQQKTQQKTETPKDILVTKRWDEAETLLSKGGKVLYLPRKADLDWTNPPLDTIPVFWNRLMGPGWGRMLGLWNDTKHPALAGFPTGPNFDWQWTEIVRDTRVINLDKLPKELQPIVQPIDDWNRNYKLGMIFECKVGRGKLMVSSADLESELDSRVAAAQLRASLLNYMAGSKFSPKIPVTAEQIKGLFFDTRVMQKLGAKVSGTGAGGDAANTIDGDPNTFWLAGNQRGERQDQELAISFPGSVAVSGLVIMPRQNHREHEGDIREYSIQASKDGLNWRELKRGELLSTFDPQTISFEELVTVKFLKFISISGFGTDKTTALAELAVIYAGPKLLDGDGNIDYQRNKSATPDIDEGTRPDDKKPKN